MVDSECRPIDRKEAEEDDNDEILGMKWALDMSSTDEDVGMKWPFDISNRDEIVQVAGYGEEKLSTVLITGTVFCNKACLASKQLLQVSPKPISGALVGAKCRTDKRDKSPSWTKAVTDKYGEFIIDLPSHLHSIQNLEKMCSVTILELPIDSPCHDSVYVGIYRDMELASFGNGIRTYTTGRMEILHTMSGTSQACIKEQEEQEMS
ncbi:unnamed protein product [Amaranthus hypochondriacus]